MYLTNHIGIVINYGSELYVVGFPCQGEPVTPSTPHIYINKGIKIQILIKSIFKTFLNTSFSNG